VELVDSDPLTVPLCVRAVDGEAVLFDDTLGEPLWLTDTDGDAV